MANILLVDSSPFLYQRSFENWKPYSEYDVTLVRAENMDIALEKVSQLSFWYIQINAETVDYLPKLIQLRDRTDDPIIILVNHFNQEDEIASYRNGADLYSTLEIAFVNSEPPSVIAYMSRFEDRIAKAVRTEYSSLASNAADTKQNPLTHKEQEILIALSQGMTREEIAVERFITVNTVKTYIRNIYNKLQAGNRAEAVSIAMSRGYIGRGRKTTKTTESYNE